jgi:hypothetical protein
MLFLNLVHQNTLWLLHWLSGKRNQQKREMKSGLTKIYSVQLRMLEILENKSVKNKECFKG